MHRKIILLFSSVVCSGCLFFTVVTHADSSSTSTQPVKAITPSKQPTKIAGDLGKLVVPSPKASSSIEPKPQSNTENSTQIKTKPATSPIPGTLTNEPVNKNLPAVCNETTDQDKKECTSPQVTDQTSTETIPIPKFELLGHSFIPGEKKRLDWSAGQSFAGGSIDSPVLVINGVHPGPKLCLTAAVHGDELNGVEIVLRLINSIQAKELKGTLIGVPIVNILGLTRGSRYLPDRRDLNRYFPGTTDGSAASRIAYLFFDNVIKHCDFLVDFHTGSGKRTNLPQLRADLNNQDVYQFTQHFGATAVLHHSGNLGMLRRAAMDAGIPAVTFELGEPGTLQTKHVDYGIAAIETLMEKLNMLKRFRLWSKPQPRFYSSTWVRTNHGGVLISKIKLGDTVSKGDKLGWVSNPISNEQTEIHASINGRILGMALNQFVLPGFAAYHIGVQAKPAPDIQIPDDVITEITEPTSDVDTAITKEANTVKQELLETPDPDELPE